jgi:hypothetical protein
MMPATMADMVRVSSRLRLECLRRRCEGQKQYQIARAAGLHPTTLSSLLHDIVPLKENDPRVLAIGRVLNIPDAECFEPYRRPPQLDLRKAKG